MTLPIDTAVDQGELHVPKSNVVISALAEPTLPITALRPPLEHDSQPLPPELLALFDRLAELGRAMRNPGHSIGAAVAEVGTAADPDRTEIPISDATSITEITGSKAL